MSINLTEVTTSLLVAELKSRGVRENEFPMPVRVHILETTLQRYVRAAGRMRDDWAESDEKSRGWLWKDLHAIESDARDILAQMPKPTLEGR